LYYCRWSDLLIVVDVISDKILKSEFYGFALRMPEY
jgi:hypothetical protein